MQTFELSNSNNSRLKGFFQRDVPRNCINILEPCYIYHMGKRCYSETLIYLENRNVEYEHFGEQMCTHIPG